MPSKGAGREGEYSLHGATATLLLLLIFPTLLIDEACQWG